MSACKHEFAVKWSVDPTHPSAEPESMLHCSLCGVTVHRKGGQPRYTTAKIPRNEFLMNCILDPQLIATHLNKQGTLIDDHGTPLVQLPAAAQHGLDDRALRIAAMLEKLRSMMCMSCEREIETDGRGICEDCNRMLAKRLTTWSLDDDS